MKTFIQITLLVLFCLSSSVAMAQKNKLSRKAKKNPYLSNNPKNHQMEDLKEEISNPTKIERDSTVFIAGSGWTNGTVTLMDGKEYEIEKMNYDLERRQLEMIFEKKVKKDTSYVMDTTYRFYSFRDFKKFSLQLHNEERDVWRLHHFVNASSYTTDEVPLVGLFELVQDGDYQLLSRYNLVSYESLDIEEKMEVSRSLELNEPRDPEVLVMEYFVKKEEFFIAMPNREVYSLKGRKKKILDHFEEKSELIKEYMKINSLDIDEREDLVHLINYCNTLESQ